MSHMSPEFSNAPFSRVTWSDLDGNPIGEETWIPSEYLEHGQYIHETVTGKYFARFSAPGYMDATDWQGPYDTEEEARADLATTFDVCPGCWEACWDSDEPCVQVCSACEEEHEPNEGSKYACPVMGPSGYVPAPMVWKRPEDLDTDEPDEPTYIFGL